MPRSGPFPGMDPYLERESDDVHTLLTTFARLQLEGRLPGALRARAERRVVVEADDEPSIKHRSIVPDVSMVETFEDAGGALRGSQAAAILEPLVLPRPEPVEYTQRYIEIIDAASGRRVVTVIEFVSPTNKRPGDGRNKYLKKRQECLDGEINFVEIDLTRSGRRELMVPAKSIPVSHRTPYQACVYRAIQSDVVELYALPLWSTLRAIRIPLRPQDEDVSLDLQPLIDEICEKGRYDVDYDSPCEPPLTKRDEQQLRQRLTQPAA